MHAMMGWIRLPMLHTSLAPLPFAGRAFGIGRPAFPAVDGYLAPGPASVLVVGWTGLRAFGIATGKKDGRLSSSPQSTAISPGSLGGGRRREATIRRRGFNFGRVASTSFALFASGPSLALGFVGRP